MKITPVTGPGAIPDTSTPEHVRTAKAIEAFNKGQSSYDKPAPTQGQAQEHPVANANNISPEEISAVRTQAPEQTEESNSDASISTETAEPAKPEIKDPEAEKRFQQIAKQERALRAKIHQANTELKRREEALKAREAALQQPQAPDLSEYVPKSRLKEDALTILEEVGVDWDNLTNQAVQRQPTDPRVTNALQKAISRIDQLEQELKTGQKTAQEQQQAQYQAALKQIKADAKQLVYTDPEFETVKAMNAVNDVVELIEKTFAEDGVVMSVEDAAKEVESYLVDEAMKITQIDKIKKRMAASKASELKTDEKKPQTEQKQPMKTLTNATSATRKMSARERAVARANGFTGDF